MNNRYHDTMVHIFLVYSPLESNSFYAMHKEIRAGEA